MQPVCQLEEFHLTKLHLDFHPPEEAEVQVKEANIKFDYAVASHRKDAHRYRMTLTIGCRAIGPDGKNVGDSIEAEIDGFFAIEGSDSKEKQQLLIRLNGVSILYGILRGIVATATGVFPGGKFVLPTVMPQEIVEMVERTRARPQSPTKITRKKTQKRPMRLATTKATKS